ncbi:MAG: hypothetical protein K2X38_17710 [Gemmataceae bacterium]|nr:hypothetical protein [Gemmataceae bacterium]
MDVEKERQLLRIRDAETDDLMAEATVFRPGMEPAALRSIDAELRERGVTAADLNQYVGERPNLLIDAHGLPWQCSFCKQPAESEGWGWHWMWGRVPVFPRWFRWCRTHVPESKSREQDGESP